MKKLFFFICLLGTSLLFAQKADYNLYFVNETAVLLENARDFSENPDFQDADFVENKAYRVVQFYEIPTLTAVKQLEQQGVVLLDYLPENAYVASFSKQLRYDFLQKYNIRSISKMRENWKLNPALLPLTKSAKIYNEESEIMVQFYANLSYKTCLQLLENKNIAVLKNFPSRNYAYIKIKTRDIFEFASQSFVLHLDVIPPVGEPEDNDSRTLHESNQLDNEYSNELRINGEGVNVQVRDDGLIGPHIDFAGRVANLTRYNGSINHGDMVVSSSGGAGNLNPRMKGIATGAYFFVTDYDQSFTDTTIGLHKYKKVMITNTSYTDGCNRYTNTSQTTDNQLRTNPKLMHVFSAGNNNSEGVVKNCGYGAGTQWGNVTGGHKQGKNGISVANIDDNMIIQPSSSRGPAHDGRLKPDVSAHGANVNMAMPNNTYTVNSGTSFSAPITAGILAVMYQAYRMENQGKDPDGALMKAVLLNSATEIGNYGPDYIHGWGVANTQRAVEMIQNQQFRVDTVAQGEEKIINFKMPNNVKLAKVMLVWTDYEALPGTKKALVNDLDLTVIAPDKTVHLPYVLNPIPTVANLSSLAKKGRDSLNNVEQVAIENPIPNAGYQAVIRGFKVPKGAQQCYLTFEYYEDVFKVIDIKKEGFTAGEIIPVRWITNGNDTSNVNISFSSDNGTNWTFVKKVKINQTHHYFTMPKVNTDKAKFQFVVGNKTHETSNFSICDVPSNIAFTKICPDSMMLEWPRLTAPVSYEIMSLGEKYMQGIAKTKDNKITIATPKNFFKNTENWFTIRTIFDSSGMIGRRRNAISVTGQLKNCPLQNDLALSQISRPVERYSSQCTPFMTDSVVVTLRNNALDSITEGSIYYQFENQPIVKEEVSFNLKKGASRNYIFQPKLNLGGIGSGKLKVWTSLLDGDQFSYNDTLVKNINYNLLNVNNFAEKLPYSQNFNEMNTNYPYGWGSVFTQNDNMTWDTVRMVSMNGGRSKMMAINFTTAANNATDELYTTPILIDSSAISPYLLFDVAYGFASETFSDRLRVTVSDNCERSNPKTLMDIRAKRLSTFNGNSGIWAPNNAKQWRTEAINLSAYKGKTITISFVGQSGQNSVLYLDNIRFENYVPKKPVAEIIVSDSMVCLNDTIYYSAKNIDPSFHYVWAFTNGSIASAIGQGPFPVIYNSTTGLPKTTLTQTSSIGTDVSTFSNITVLKLPVSKFTALTEDLKVTLNNQSTDATDYLWDFGDSTTSTEKTPTHDYLKSGSYTITLTAINSCNISQSTRKINVNSIAVKDIFENLNAEIQPNPNNGYFDLIINNQLLTDATISIADVVGKVLWSKEYSLVEGVQRLKINPILNSGIYFISIKSKDRQGTLKFIVN